MDLKETINNSEEFKKIVGKMLEEFFPGEYHSRGMYAGLQYILSFNFEKKHRQEDVAFEWHTTPVTVRKHYKKIKKLVSQERLIELYVSKKEEVLKGEMK